MSRSIFVSDFHLSSIDCQTEQFYSFLDDISCEYLYLIGDIIDLWAMKRKWRWPKINNEIIHKLLKMSRKGTAVYYIPGNHDAFFRHYSGHQFGGINIVNEIVHRTNDNRHFVVMHGDQFDTIIKNWLWLSKLGDCGYDWLVRISRFLNKFSRFSLAHTIKSRVKDTIQYMMRFEELAAKEAASRGFDGIICGHSHQPKFRDIDGTLYYNTGDWVDNCSFVVEHDDGRLDVKGGKNVQ